VEPLHYSFYPSPVGRLTVGVSQRGLLHIDLRGAVPQNNARRQWIESEQHTAPYRTELREYFAGKRRKFTVPLDLRGTQFQLRCWRALSDIPYGDTRTYADLARVVGSPKGFRAVGAANHDNPVPIIVPCHRVIASDGSLCGFGGGLEMKRALLELEGIRIAQNLPLFAVR
jgi:methylated-DNA-[protein]-cysteine S-methyltransferase